MKKDRVLGVPIKFKPVFGNVDHIKILEVLDEIARKRKSYEKAMEEKRKAEKLRADIDQLEGKARRLIEEENNRL